MDYLVAYICHTYRRINSGMFQDCVELDNSEVTSEIFTLENDCEINHSLLKQLEEFIKKEHDIDYENGYITVKILGVTKVNE